jgi:hypothetical protein
MRTLFNVSLILCFFSLSSSAIFAQDKIAEFDAVPGFSKLYDASGYYLNSNKTYAINLQVERDIHRFQYDESFKLLNSYSFESKDITFNRSHGKTPLFVTDLQSSDKVFEIFADKNSIVVVAPDFINKKDSLLYKLELGISGEDEKRLAIMPYSSGIRVLTYIHKRKSLNIYQWDISGQVSNSLFLLPSSSLNSEEIKKYGKSAGIKYKAAFDDVIVCRADAENIIGQAGTNSIYYSENKAWILSQAPSFTGYNILTLDFATNSLDNNTIMLNDIEKNNSTDNSKIFHPYAAIVNGHLFIRNTSYYYYEYHIYDLKTMGKVKEYISENEESIRKLIHSDLNQKGTWLSGNDEKKLDNEKAFLRKVNSGKGFIALSNITADSITITTGSLNVTTGLGGMVLSLATMELGSLLNITIGSFQIIPYLAYYRNKMIYCHSRFSTKTLEPSQSVNITTTLDLLMENFEKKDLKSKSTFLIRKNGSYLISVFNSSTKKFELVRLGNE